MRSIKKIWYAICDILTELCDGSSWQVWIENGEQKISEDDGDSEGFSAEKER